MLKNIRKIATSRPKRWY